MPARTKEVEVGGRRVTVREMTVLQLKEVLPGLVARAWERVVGANSARDLVDRLFTVLEEDLPELLGAPELRGEAMRNAYPSELEAAVGAWLELNFFWLRKLLGPLWPGSGMLEKLGPELVTRLIDIGLMRQLQDLTQKQQSSSPANSAGPPTS